MKSSIKLSVCSKGHKSMQNYQFMFNNVYYKNALGVAETEKMKYCWVI